MYGFTELADAVRVKPSRCVLKRTHTHTHTRAQSARPVCGDASALHPRRAHRSRSIVTLGTADTTVTVKGVDSHDLWRPSGDGGRPTPLRDLSVHKCDNCVHRKSQLQVLEERPLLQSLGRRPLDAQLKLDGRAGVRRVERAHQHGRQVAGGVRVFVAHDHSLSVEPLLYLEHVAACQGGRLRGYARRRGRREKEWERGEEGERKREEGGERRQ